VSDGACDGAWEGAGVGVIVGVRVGAMYATMNHTSLRWLRAWQTGTVPVLVHTKTTYSAKTTSRWLQGRTILVHLSRSEHPGPQVFMWT